MGTGRRLDGKTPSNSAPLQSAGGPSSSGQPSTSGCTELCLYMCALPLQQCLISVIVVCSSMSLGQGVCVQACCSSVDKYPAEGEYLNAESCLYFRWGACGQRCCKEEGGRREGGLWRRKSAPGKEGGRPGSRCRCHCIPSLPRKYQGVHKDCLI